MARIFIGIPTLERPGMVIDTIASVLCQSYADYRVIVSDNGSSGDTADRVERHVRELNDPRFSFYRQPVNGGEYGQGRFFFAAAAGDAFFMIVHDDDVLKPDYLEIAIRALDKHKDAAFFVANPYLMDIQGVVSPTQTTAYHRYHGRENRPEGMFDVLSMHMNYGFTPISGTLFRKRALNESGFVDPDCFGNYPFEANIFLRLGDIGAKAWFSPRELMGVRYHPQSLRGQYPLQNASLVSTSIKIYERRRFAGQLEDRRKAVLARFYRADGVIKLRDGDRKGASTSLRRAIRENSHSAKSWALAASILLVPGATRVFMIRLNILTTLFNPSAKWWRSIRGEAAGRSGAI